MSTSPEARSRIDRFQDHHALEIHKALPNFSWERDYDRRADSYCDPIKTSAVDPLEGTPFVLRTDKKFIRTFNVIDEVERPSQIPTFLFPDHKHGGWQVLPLLEIENFYKPDSVYRLYANFDRRNHYQLGPGLRLQYQGWTTVNSGEAEEPALVVRSVYGSEASDVKSTLERLLAIDLR